MALEGRDFFGFLVGDVFYAVEQVHTGVGPRDGHPLFVQAEAEVVPIGELLVGFFIQVWDVDAIDEWAMAGDLATGEHADGVTAFGFVSCVLHGVFPDGLSWLIAAQLEQLVVAVGDDRG